MKRHQGNRKALLLCEEHMLLHGRKIGWGHSLNVGGEPRVVGRTLRERRRGYQLSLCCDLFLLLLLHLDHTPQQVGYRSNISLQLSKTAVLA